MRVLQINTERTWRGGERQTMYTIEGLLASGVEVGLLCRDHFPLHRRARELPVACHPVQSTAQGIEVASLAGRNYDIVHAQSAKGQSIAVLSYPVHRKPVIYTRRVNFPLRGRSSILKYRFTTRTIAISSAIRNMLALYGINDVTVISSAVKQRELNVERARDLLDRLKLPENTRIIGTVGNLVPQKDPLLMVEVVRELTKLRDDFVLLQFGGRGTLGDDVEARIMKHGLSRWIHLLGHRKDVEDFFALFEVFLATGNETEGLNSSVYDAFVYEVPVVSTFSGGLRDSVSDRGLTCVDPDPKCLAEQVNRLLDDDSLSGSLVSGAKEWALETVSIPAITAQYLQVYEQLLKNR